MIKENGFSLIEVTVASLIIMMGVTGYVTLQSEYVVTDTNLNLRGLALDLAREKLTDLAFFQRLGQIEGSSSFQEITNNTGGTIPAGEREIVLSSELNLQTYDIRWEVEDLYYVDTNFDGVSESWVKVDSPFFPIEMPRNANLKNVHITVTWLDTNGNNKQIDMFGSIAPIEQSQSFQTKYRSSSALAEP